MEVAHKHEVIVGKLDGDEVQGRGFDKPMTPSEAAQVIKTNKKGVGYIPRDLHQGLMVQIVKKPFPARLRAELKKDLTHFEGGVMGGRLQELLNAWEEMTLSATLVVLPRDAYEWLKRAGTPCHLQFYAAWCVMQCTLGETPLPHYVASLDVAMKKDGVTGQWEKILATLAPQQASQAA